MPQHAVAGYPVLYCPLPHRVAPVFVQVVSPLRGWPPLSYCLVMWSPSDDTRGTSVVFEAVDMPFLGPFHCSHSVDHSYDSCPISDPDVGISICGGVGLALLAGMRC